MGMNSCYVEACVVTNDINVWVSFINKLIDKYGEDSVIENTCNNKNLNINKIVFNNNEVYILRTTSTNARGYRYNKLFIDKRLPRKIELELSVYLINGTYDENKIYYN